MTRFDSPADLHDEIPQLDRTSRSWVTAVLFGVVTVVLGVAWTFTFLIAAFTALAFIYGGFIYGVIGTTVITARWIMVPLDSSRPPADEINVTEVHRFATGAQRNTLVLNIVLLLNFGAFFLTTLTSTPSDFVGGEEIFMGSIAQVAGLALIVVNGVWAYRRWYIVGEHEAMKFRVGRYRLIAANRGLSYLVWILYTAAAAYMVFSAFTPGSSPLDLFLDGTVTG